MTVVFDTTTVAAAERADRLRVALAEASLASVTLGDAGGDVHARLEMWPLASSYLFRAATSPVRMFRTERQARSVPVPLLALAVQERGAALHRQFAPVSHVRPGALMGMDMTAAFDFSWSTHAGSRALMMPLDELGLSGQQLRDALPRLADSPLYGLVTRHIVELFGAADAIDTPSVAENLSAVSLDLARALIESVSADGPARRDAAARTLMIRVRDHIRRNLRDPGLSAATIAAAHHVSLRHLYKVCSAAGVSLEQLIIRRRLHGAHAELSLPAAQHHTIESVARAWGFRNVTHFTRRFGEEFGVSPREWRHISATTQR
jgi:AraC-like DNA-binding protein